MLALVLMIFNIKPVKAGTQDFVIDSFEANYLISRDSDNVSVAYVREGITATFPNFDQNHGILRAIPETYNGHSLEIKIDRVIDEKNNAYNYDTYSENSNLVLKIGDADKYVHGTKKYFIDYHMRGVISKQADHDEFYWNINGTQWQQPINKVWVRVRVDDALHGLVEPSSILPQRVCYTGVAGSTASDCKITPYETGVDFETTSPLAAGENLTVVMAFSKDTFANYQPSREQVTSWVLIGLGIILPPIVALWVMVRNWRRYGRDPEATHTVVPEYLPPKDTSVLMSSTVLNEGMQPNALAAQLIDFAVRHYIKVYELEKRGIFSKQDYELELVKDFTSLRPEEKEVMQTLFPDQAVGSKLNLSSLAGGAGIAKSGGKQPDQENAKLFDAFKVKVALAKLTEDLPKRAATEGYFRISPNKARAPYLAVGGVLGIVGFLFLPASLGLVLAGGILLVGSIFMPARTAKGVDLRLYLLGLRDYIKLAEADRLKVLQSPHGNLTEKIDITDKKKLVKLYERLLPYAMLFGLEKQWAKELAPLYESEPDWYHGAHPFTTAHFASSFAGFSSAAGTTFAPPSSSSGSGFSGGSSGGGGGGGGGGGW